MLYCTVSLFVMDVGSNLISRKEGKWQSVKTSLSQESKARVHVLPHLLLYRLAVVLPPQDECGVAAGCWALGLCSLEVH